MRITHFATAPTPAAQSQRGGMARVKALMHGAGNGETEFEMHYVTYAGPGNHSPRHNHNFDQFRYVIKGRFEHGERNQSVPEGCLGFITSGCTYGPFSNDPSSIFMVLQLAGPGGEGYSQNEANTKAIDELSKRGEFQSGSYIYTGDDGKVHKKDGWRAVYEQARGRPFKAPKARYTDVLVMDPAAYDWVPLMPGVSEKLLGIFNERGTCAWMLHLDPGAKYERLPGVREEVMFVLAGHVAVSDDECVQYDACYFQRGDSASFTAVAETTILGIGFPAFVPAISASDRLAQR